MTEDRSVVETKDGRLWTLSSNSYSVYFWHGQGSGMFACNTILLHYYGLVLWCLTNDH